MPRPRVLILRAPGTNCDGETAFAFETAGAQTEKLHVNRLQENPKLCAQYQILCIPGGFSFGDDIAAGRILGNQIRHHLRDALEEFRAAGKLILGVCNGFQVLIKSGILLKDLAASSRQLSAVSSQPSVRSGQWSVASGQQSETSNLKSQIRNSKSEILPAATLTWNDSGRFEDRWVRLVTSGEKCVFLKGIERMYLPVAHAEGKFVAADSDVLGDLERGGQLVLRYANKAGKSDAVPYPENPNGAQHNVAGVCDESGRVLGLMPHPERHIDPTQHPRWTRGEAGKVGDGLRVFQNAVAYFA